MGKSPCARLGPVSSECSKQRCRTQEPQYHPSGPRWYPTAQQQCTLGASQAAHRIRGYVRNETGLEPCVVPMLRGISIQSGAWALFAVQHPALGERGRGERRKRKRKRNPVAPRSPSHRLMDGCMDWVVVGVRPAILVPLCLLFVLVGSAPINYHLD